MFEKFNEFPSFIKMTFPALVLGLNTRIQNGGTNMATDIFFKFDEFLNFYENKKWFLWSLMNTILE